MGLPAAVEEVPSIQAHSYIQITSGSHSHILAIITTGHKLSRIAVPALLALLARVTDALTSSAAAAAATAAAAGGGGTTTAEAGEGGGKR